MKRQKSLSNNFIVSKLPLVDRKVPVQITNNIYFKKNKKYSRGFTGVPALGVMCLS